QVEGGLLLDVIISKSAAVFKLLTGEDQPLLVWRDAFLVLDLGLDIVDGVRALNLESDGFASEGFYKDLHATPETENQVECGLLLDVIVSKSAAILKLFTSKDKPLLIWWDPLLILDLGLDIVNCVRAFDLKGDGLASESFYKDLHLLYHNSQHSNKLEKQYIAMIFMQTPITKSYIHGRNNIKKILIKPTKILKKFDTHQLYRNPLINNQFINKNKDFLQYIS
ncbi:hypothetical protein CFOL_v3_07953, partial [Cephalotus follicularis]